MMALPLVFFGVLVGLAAAACTLSFGGGIGLAFLAYTAAGMAGMAAGLAGTLLSKDAAAIKVGSDKSRTGANARHPG